MILMLETASSLNTMIVKQTLHRRFIAVEIIIFTSWLLGLHNYVLLEMERFRSLELWTVDGISGVGKLSRSFIFLEFSSSGGLFREDSTP